MKLSYRWITFEINKLFAVDANLHRYSHFWTISNSVTMQIVNNIFINTLRKPVLHLLIYYSTKIVKTQVTSHTIPWPTKAENSNPSSNSHTQRSQSDGAKLNWSKGRLPVLKDKLPGYWFTPIKRNANGNKQSSGGLKVRDREGWSFSTNQSL